MQNKNLFIGFAYKDVLYYFAIIHSAHRKGIINFYNIQPNHTILTSATEPIIKKYEEINKLNIYNKTLFYNEVMNILKKLNTINAPEDKLLEMFYIPENFFENPNSTIMIWRTLLSFHEAMQFVAQYNKEIDVMKAKTYIQTLYDYSKSGMIYSNAEISNIASTHGERKKFFVHENIQDKNTLLTSNNLPLIYKQTAIHISPILHQIDIYAKNTIGQIINNLENYIYIKLSTDAQNQNIPNTSED